MTDGDNSIIGDIQQQAGAAVKDITHQIIGGAKTAAIVSADAALMAHGLPPFLNPVDKKRTPDLP